MSIHTKEELENMMEDVVNELDLSDCMLEKHGPLGTPPSEMVREVLDQKDREIAMLKAGMISLLNGKDHRSCKRIERELRRSGELKTIIDQILAGEDPNQIKLDL